MCSGRLAAWAYKLTIMASAVMVFVLTIDIWSNMLASSSSIGIFAAILPVAAQAVVDLEWHAPAESDINNITRVFSTQGVYGFIFNSSDTGDKPYGTYNWCNMPHARKTEYPIPSNSDLTLKYVEVVSCLSFQHKPTKIDT